MSDQLTNSVAIGTAPFVITSTTRVANLNVATAGTADELTTARTISITGDMAWTTTFNGNGNVTGVGTLTNSGVTAGTYTKVTVDSKGRVTSGTTLAASDVPTLNQNTTGSAAKWTTARTITLTGGVSGTTTIDGSGNVSINTTLN
jgi:phage-related tail fiber protein